MQPKSTHDRAHIVVAEDDEDDRILTAAALEESHFANPVDFVADGEELMTYLRRDDQPLPALILLDWNMPRKGGREVLHEIRQDDSLRHLPVIVLTTSQQEEDVRQSYMLGANSFITKPVTFEGLVAIMNMVYRYWFQVVQLPLERQQSRH